MVGGTKMGDRWWKIAAFFASLLLTLAVFDAAPRASLPSPKVVSQGEEQFSLRLDVRTSGSDRAPPDVALTIFEEVSVVTPTGAPAFSYRKVRDFLGAQAASSTQKLPRGRYWVVARAPGRARASVLVQLDADKSIQLTLQPAASLLVRVLATQEEELVPLAGATVLVGERAQLPLGGRTDKQGEAKFEALAPGPQPVRIYAPGYAPYEAVAEGELVVRLRPVSTLRVHVKDGDAPQADAHVFIAGAELWPTRTVLTGGSGYVDLAGLRPGRYSLYAEKGTQVSQTQSDVVVPEVAGIVEVTLHLRVGVFVRALIREKATEKPIESARVTWSSSGLGQFSRHAQSDGAGMVQIGPLSQWGGVMRARASGYVSRVVAVELPGERDPKAPPYQVIDLDEAAIVEGRVVDADGFPVVGATVEIAGTDLFQMPISITYLSDEVSDAHFDWTMQESNVLIPAGELGVMLGPVPPIPLGDVIPREGRTLTSDERGYFVVDDVPPGEAVVLARHPDHMDGKSPILKLAPAARVKTTVVLGKGEPLRGRVLDHRGFPVVNARVQVTGKGFDRRVTADTDGTFSLPAAPGRVTVRVARLERPLDVVFAREISDKERAQEIAIDLPEPRAEAVVRVVDNQGEPIPLAQVSVVSLDASAPFKKTIFSDDTGRAHFDEAATLRVRLSVSAPGFVEVSSEKRLAAELAVKLGRSVTIKGTVRGVRGRLPATGASIVFRAGALKRGAIADEMGNYRIAGVPPGVGELSASHPEFGKGKLTVRVEHPSKGDEQDVKELILSPTLEVSGRVIDITGAPLAGAFVATSRLSPYLALGGLDVMLGRSDENGEFVVEVERSPNLYLYGALSGRSYGFSDVIPETDLDRIEDVDVVLDRDDKIPPNELGTVLIAVEDRGRDVTVYAVAEGSDAKQVGLRPDDVIVEVDGSAPQDAAEARVLMSGPPATDVRLVVHRRGSRHEWVVAREPFVR